MLVRADDLQKSELEIVQCALIARRKVVQVRIYETKHEATVHECETSLCATIIKIKIMINIYTAIGTCDIMLPLKSVRDSCSIRVSPPAFLYTWSSSMA